MLKRLAAGLCGLAILAGPSLAQSNCDPKTLAAAVDRYAVEPFSARTWRVLQGLGDPMVGAGYPGGDTYDEQDRWKKLSGDILGEAGRSDTLGYDCRVSYPLSVLEKRIGSLGKDHPYVKQWALAQQQVFRACSEESGDVSLPAPLEIEPSYINLQKMDRAYQEASIAFYRDRERAIPMFRAIAGSQSPHRAAARYNIANLLANAKQPKAARKEAEAILADPSLASVHAITRALLGYIANQEDTAEAWTGVIERDVAVINAPAAQLAGDEAKREYATALYDIDFAGVRGKDDDWWLDGTLPENATISKALVDMARKHAMVLWMMAGQSANAKYDSLPWSLVGKKFQDRMTAYVGKALSASPSGGDLKGPALDMLKALSAKPDDATRAELWAKARQASEAAAASCGADAQTAAAGFLLSQAVRLSAMAGKYDEAYQGLDAVPFKMAGAFLDRAVLKMAQDLAGQGNTAEARKLRDRYLTADALAAIKADPGVFANNNAYAGLLALIAEDEAHYKAAIRYGDDPSSSVLLNFLPTTVLWSFADDTEFSAADRALFARAAWTRDYALRRKVVDEHVDSLHNLNPQMKEIAEKARADYPAATGENLRLLTILRSPRHNILVSVPSDWDTAGIKPESFTDIDSFDHNDKNWWCPFEPDRQLGALRAQADAATGVPDLASGMKQVEDVLDLALRNDLLKTRDQVLKAHPMVKAVNWKEIAALSAVPSAPKRLTQAAIRWGKASKGDDGAPEALALAVKATRYGCNWHGGHEAYSRPAQELLRAKFGATDWAKQTPYWFGCMRQEWDKDYNKVATCKPQTWPKQAPLR